MRQPALRRVDNRKLKRVLWQEQLFCGRCLTAPNRPPREPAVGAPVGDEACEIQVHAVPWVRHDVDDDGVWCLLVGVDDDGATIGLSREIQGFHTGKTDKFLLHFKNLLKSRIGEQFYPYINQKLISIVGTYVLMVECKRSSRECFVDTDFYVRTNPATDKLEGKKLIDYIRNHFAS